MKVVVGGERVEQFDLGARQPGVAEQRDAFRQLGRGLLQCGKGFGVADVRRIGVDPVQQGTPQGRLPQQIRVDVAVDGVLPVDEQVWPLAGVGREQSREPPGDGIAPTLPQLALLAGFEVAEVGGQCLAPALVAAVVDDAEQRPDHRVG